jgi:hypothetical protein
MCQRNRQFKETTGAASHIVRIKFQSSHNLIRPPLTSFFLAHFSAIETPASMICNFFFAISRLALISPVDVSIELLAFPI